MGARRYSGSSIEDKDEDEDVWDEVAEVAEEAGAEVEAEVEEAVNIEEGEVDEEACGDSILQCYKASRSLKTPESRVLKRETNRKGHSMHQCAMHNKRRWLPKEADK